MKKIIFVVVMIQLCSHMSKISFGQETLEFLDLQEKYITSLSLNDGLIAVGTNRNGVYWQMEYMPSDTGWNHIELDSQSVQTVYAHKSGPIGWAISAGVVPYPVDSAFIYCSFLGGEFVANSMGIPDSLTIGVSELDGFPDPTICGETYAAGGDGLDTESAILFFSKNDGDNWQRFPLHMSCPIVDMEFGINGWIYFAFDFIFNMTVEDPKTGAVLEEELEKLEAFIETYNWEEWRGVIWWGSAKLAQYREEYSQAIASYQKAVETKIGWGEKAFLISRIGQCYRKLKEFKEAKETLQKALQFEPFSPLTHYELALVYWEQDKKEQAMEHLNTALKVWEEADAEYKPAKEAREKLAEWGLVPKSN